MSKSQLGTCLLQKSTYICISLLQCSASIFHTGLAVQTNITLEDLTTLNFNCKQLHLQECGKMLNLLPFSARTMSINSSAKSNLNLYPRIVGVAASALSLAVPHPPNQRTQLSKIGNLCSEAGSTKWILLFPANISITLGTNTKKFALALSDDCICRWQTDLNF